MVTPKGENSTYANYVVTTGAWFKNNNASKIAIGTGDYKGEKRLIVVLDNSHIKECFAIDTKNQRVSNPKLFIWKIFDHYNIDKTLRIGITYEMEPVDVANKIYALKVLYRKELKPLN